MPIQLTFKKGLVPVHVWADEIESEAIDQLVNVSMLPIVYKAVAAMPDVHAGRGCTVGAVIPTRHAIIPATVGVDIGCGMIAVQTTLMAEDLPDSLRSVREAIEEAVPVGFAMHGQGSARNQAAKGLEPGLRQILVRTPELEGYKKDFEKDWVHQLASLGGGNHFIELCLDAEGGVWIMLHSGSRGVGNVIGRHFIEVAKTEMERLDVRLPHRDLAYLTEGTESFSAYWQALTWAQEYAHVNRAEMLDLVVKALSGRVGLPPFTLKQQAVNCHHNYATLEDVDGVQVYMTRKGAIRAGAGELGIIPGSMGQRSYIVRGRGSEESFCSCSHGAGRRMSRTEAKRHFTVQDLIQQTEGVECRKDAGVLDEIPGSYKPIEQTIANQTDLVDVVHVLKQVVCVKG
jgi:tRNA-splicing ligase RtcB